MHEHEDLKPGQRAKKLFTKTNHGRVLILFWTVCTELLLIAPTIGLDGLFELAGRSTAQGNMITALLGAPLAFCLWKFRDDDKRRDQEQSDRLGEQDDFHKLQEWAANREASPALRIAALQQLAEHMRLSKERRQAAVEIFRAIFLQSDDAPSADNQPKAGEVAAKEAEEAEENKPQAEHQHRRHRPNSVQLAIERLMSEDDYQKFFREKEWRHFNLSRIDWRGIRLFELKLPGADLSRAYLIGANLTGADLEGANLTGAKYTKGQYPTKWPAEFNLEESGAVEVSENG